MVSCILKLLTATNRVRYIRINTKANLLCFLNFSKKSTFSRINQDRYYFSPVFETGISFSSSFRHMTYNYYLKQPMPMCEIRLNEISAKNLRHLYRLSTYSNNSITGKYTHQEIIFVINSFF